MRAAKIGLAMRVIGGLRGDAEITAIRSRWQDYPVALRKHAADVSVGKIKKDGVDADTEEAISVEIMKMPRVRTQPSTEKSPQC